MQARSLHVTIVSTQANWHGGEKQAALLAEGLQQHGHRCSLICREGGEFARRMQGRVEFHTIPKSVRSPVSIYRARRILEQLKPDILHANDAHGLTTAGIASLGLSIPIRVAARRVDFQLRSPQRYRMLCDGLVCVSSSVADICNASGIPREQLHVVHDGVEPTFAESGSRSRGRDSLGLNRQHRLLLTVAKLTDHKGHRYLLEALPELVKIHPGLVVAFAGDGELREELETLAQKLGVGHAVRFLGYRNDVNDLLAASDLIVQPSHMEGLCSSLIDAMFAARPIVATSAGGIPDLLDVSKDSREHAQVGWLVAPRDPHALANAIQEVLEDNQQAIDRGLAARDRAMRLFTADQMVERTLQTYEKIAQQRYGAHAAFAELFSTSWRSRRLAA